MPSYQNKKKKSLVMNGVIVGDEFLYARCIFSMLYLRDDLRPANKMKNIRGTFIYSLNKQQLEHNKTNDMNRTRIGSERKTQLNDFNTGIITEASHFLREEFILLLSFFFCFIHLFPSTSVRLNSKH